MMVHEDRGLVGWISKWYRNERIRTVAHVLEEGGDVSCLLNFLPIQLRKMGKLLVAHPAELYQLLVSHEFCPHGDIGPRVGAPDRLEGALVGIFPAHCCAARAGASQSVAAV